LLGRVEVPVKMFNGDMLGPAPCRMSDMSPRIATKSKAPSFIVVRKMAESVPMDLDIRLRMDTRMIAMMAVI